jgi:hypothetical protein
MTSSEFYVSTAINLARKMPMGEGILFLKGMLEVADGSPVAPTVRKAYNALFDCDHQLDLIASGQLKLELPAAPVKGKR